MRRSQDYGAARHPTHAAPCAALRRLSGRRRDAEVPTRPEYPSRCNPLLCHCEALCETLLSCWSSLCREFQAMFVVVLHSRSKRTYMSLLGPQNQSRTIKNVPQLSNPHRIITITVHCTLSHNNLSSSTNVANCMKTFNFFISFDFDALNKYTFLSVLSDLSAGGEGDSGPDDPTLLNKCCLK